MTGHAASTSTRLPRTTLTRRDLLGRTTGLLTASAFGGTLLTSGCGAGGGSGPLKFWQFYAPGGENPKQVRWFTELVRSWNKDNEAKVELQYVPPTSYLNGSKLQTAFAADEGPDIFLLSSGDFLRYYNGGVLQDLTPFLEDEARNDYFPNLMPPRRVDGKIYALPINVGVTAIFYSVRAFEKAKLSGADVPKTWEELLDVATKLRNRDQYGILFESAPGYYQNFTWYPFLWMGDGDVVTKSGDASAFDSPAAVQALALWRDAVEAGVTPRKTLGNGGNDVPANLGSGYCAMQEMTTGAIAEMESSRPKFEYGVFKLPLPPGGSYGTNLGGWAFAVNAKGADPEAAARFCAWAVGSMSKESVDRVARWCGEANSFTAPRKSAQQKLAELESGGRRDELMKLFRDDIFPGGRAEPRYPPDVYKAVSDAIQACQLKGADPQREAARASEQIDSFLNGYTGARIL